MTLSLPEAKALYDAFGSRQDAQGFYEEAALDALVRASDFGSAESVFEFGCGTGRFAQRLLIEELPASAKYTGCDTSPVMLQLAESRLSPYRCRSLVLESGVEIAFPLENGSVDRVVSTYVLDLLSEGRIHAFLSESVRVLSSCGHLYLVGLTNGENPSQRSFRWPGRIFFE